MTIRLVVSTDVILTGHRMGVLHSSLNENVLDVVLFEELCDS